MNKVCTKCNVSKSLTEFGKRKDSKSGYTSHCLSCKRNNNKKYYTRNSCSILKNHKSWRERNPEYHKSQSKKWDMENRDRRREYRKEYEETNKDKIRLRKQGYFQEHKAKFNARCRKYQANKLNATPNWLTEYQHKQIELKYWISNFLTEYTGVEHHVDHIYPLQGKNICGLHVPGNLQILTAKDNLSKGNR